MAGVVVFIPKREFVLSQKRLAFVLIAEVPFPKRTLPAVNVDAPVPPFATARVPVAFALSR